MSRLCEVYARMLDTVELYSYFHCRFGFIHRRPKECSSSGAGGEADKQGIGKHTVSTLNLAIGFDILICMRRQKFRGNS